MKTRDMLPAELLWEDDAHLSEVALTALADGEDAIVPERAHLHLAECEHCARKLGQLAVLSFEAGAALVAMEAAREAEALSRPRPKLPIFAMAAALIVAVIGALPTLRDLPALLSQIKWLFSDGLPLVVDEVVHFFGSARTERTLAIVSVASTLFFVGVGVLIARSRARGASGAVR